MNADDVETANASSCHENGIEISEVSVVLWKDNVSGEESHVEESDRAENATVVETEFESGEG
jgi:hypothetical protein